MALKNSKEMTLDELVELAKKPTNPKDKKTKNLSAVNRFIHSDNVKQGNELIPSLVFYDRYVKWCSTYQEKALSSAPFFKDLKLYFTKKMDNITGSSYLASPEGFDLSPEHLHKLTEEFKKGHGRGIGKKKTAEEKATSKKPKSKASKEEKSI